MRTMFVPHEKNGKKKFQKPNILRKKPKLAAKTNVLEAFESPDTASLVSECFIKETTDETQSEGMATLSLHSHLEHQTPATRDELNNELQMPSESTDHKYIFNNNGMLESEGLGENVQSKSNEENSNEALVNIESFFSDATAENVMLYDIDCDPGTSIEALVVIDNESPVSNVLMEHTQDEVNNSLPLSTVSNEYPDLNQTDRPAASHLQNFYSQFTPIKYQCKVPNCNKEFRSEQKFKKHQNTHCEDGSIRAPRQVTVECPVKRIEADGTEQSCGKIFLVRDQLIKHLNEDHTLDDAVYRCEECGRRFFWSSGLRAHVRAHCRQAATAGAGPAGRGAGRARAPLVCAWAGCGRVFRQPCRLREHARAHTGDRPYPCDYPNCGWSFRSASKLMRHARRHTGERKHACTACDQAFLRREHLRDHVARYHALRRAHPCHHPGCEQTFNNMSTLYLHMKKVHKNKDSPSATTTSETESFFTLEKTDDNMFLVNVSPECGLSDDVSAEGGLVLAETGAEELAEVGAETEAETEAEGEWHSARTHCTWPLEGRAGHCDINDDDNLLKDDSHVEQLEGSESNTYTVRSDLFLHGNVMINDDSQHMGACVGAGAEGAGEGAGAGSPLGAGLGLLDAHPTIDLMQEELMYADTAADESSFRIFLLSGEELT
ncbi:gastrula zinc finger protein xFG20-1-like isoform X1 [Ostrinia furnacalis]|uniref:gastrula zinc finger protein xFG20-1-like isoform X1 n=1 Tax=Ostrinia furnacalis TaxID=93504 RepID=UPI00103CC90C|nr:gastrula zinc finger protein xFG20-1-like isoform X1 [Ostrinia furnacalis]